MKILHVVPSLAQAHGGATRAVELMEDALIAQGVSLETATTDDAGDGKRNGKRCGERLDESGRARWYFPLRSRLYKISPGFARWINARVRDYDLVHIHALFSFTSAVAARGGGRAGVPYVIEPLGTLNAYGLTQRRPLIKRLSLRFIEGPLLRDAAAVRFTSRDEALQARRLGIPLREALIPLGIGTGAAPSPRAGPAATPRLLFLSRLDPKKNLEGLIDALAIARSEWPGVHLVVAGDGEPGYIASLKSRAQRAGVLDRIRWAGYIEGEAKARAFADADVFVLPSFSENFGLAVVEALAAGVPCVLGEGVGITAEVVRAEAGVGTGTDAQSIASGLRRIIRGDEQWRAMSANAQRLARESFSLDAMGTSLSQLYAGILNR
jgi:glycosyltransferase involved in cell wall biosynthesis